VPSGRQPVVRFDERVNWESAGCGAPVFCWCDRRSGNWGNYGRMCRMRCVGVVGVMAVVVAIGVGLVGCMTTPMQPDVRTMHDDSLLREYYSLSSKLARANRPADTYEVTPNRSGGYTVQPEQPRTAFGTAYEVQRRQDIEFAEERRIDIIMEMRRRGIKP